MKIEVAEKVCSTCPWREENSHQLHYKTIVEMLDNGVISSCHQVQAKVEGCTCNTGVEIYADDCIANDKPFILCRGMALARAKAMMVHTNPQLMLIDAQMRLEDDYEESDVKLVDMTYVRLKAGS